MDKLDKSAIHHLFVQHIPRQQRYLVAIQFAQCFSCQLSTYRLFDSIHKSTYEGIHTLACSFAQYSITNYHFFHTDCKDSTKRTKYQILEQQMQRNACITFAAAFEIQHFTYAIKTLLICLRR